LNWFMPALVNSNVGSSCGTTGDDGTNVWPCFFTKKSMNCCRISLDVGMEHLNHQVSQQRPALRFASSARNTKQGAALFPALHRGVPLTQGDPVFSGDAGTILILGGQHTSSVPAPAALGPHETPSRFDCHRLALHLAALHSIAPNPQRSRFTEQDE